MGYIIAALSTFLGKLFADELKAWLPWITERVFRRAVSILPMDRQERCREEWRSDLNQVPGDLGRLFWAVDLIRAAYRLSDITPAGMLFGRVAALLLLLFYGPLFLIIALLIKLSSPGPIFHRYNVSNGGGVFSGIRFRTFQCSPTDFGPYAVLHCYPRMTPMTQEEEMQLDRLYRSHPTTLIGRYLILSGIHDLPQLLNVFSGHVSLRALFRGMSFGKHLEL